MNFKGNDLGITLLLLKICLVKFLTIPLYSVCSGDSGPPNGAPQTLKSGGPGLWALAGCTDP